MPEMNINRSGDYQFIFVRPTPSGHSLDVDARIRSQPKRLDDLAQADAFKDARATANDPTCDRFVVKVLQIGTLVKIQKLINLYQVSAELSCKKPRQS